MPQLLQRLFLFYCFSLPFTKDINLPGFQLPFALPELLFLITLPVGVLAFVQQRPEGLRWWRLDTAVAALMVLTLVTAAGHPTPESGREVLTRGYLIAAYAMARLCLAYTPSPGKYLLSLFSGLGGIAAATVFFAWLLWVGWDGAGFEIIDPKYLPGYGFVPRMEAFMMSPNQLANLLVMCILLPSPLLFRSASRTTALVATILLLVIALAGTFSKSLVLFAAVLFFGLSQQLVAGRISRRILRVLSVTFILYFTVNVSFLLLPRQAEDRDIALHQDYLTGQTFPLGDRFLGAETTAFRLKRAAWQMFREAPWLGIGPGNFPKKLEEYQIRGDYPAGKPIYDPHSSWTGSLAEMGLGGLLVVASLFILLLQAAFAAAAENDAGKSAWFTGFMLFFLFIAFDGFAMDILNFRHLWVAMGCFTGMIQKMNPEHYYGAQ